MSFLKENLKAMARSARGVWRYLNFLRSFAAFAKLNDEQRPKRFEAPWRQRYPCLNDNTKSTGFDRHYIYHPAWAARIIAATRPAEHVDISSTLNFCTLISAFVPTRFYDFRPADVHLSGLQSESANLSKLTFASDSIASLSCMHVVEHIGLGRYGDPIDPSGDLKAMKELARVLAVDGNLLFVVPVGQPVIMFNAHRVYSYEQVVSAFDGLSLEGFALISEHQKDGGLNFEAGSEEVAMQSYGCGCFWFKKIQGRADVHAQSI
ncbi:MAG: DUF268 domain-containing protein [Polaromonas sp.]|nr:DUF268 domain-containing protein [Polaromonas sp.]